MWRHQPWWLHQTNTTLDTTPDSKIDSPATSTTSTTSSTSSTSSPNTPTNSSDSSSSNTYEN